MKISFEGKVALVTGAASGLGLATAKAFAEAGASVVLADRNEKNVEAAAKQRNCTIFRGKCDWSRDQSRWIASRCGGITEVLYWLGQGGATISGRRAGPCLRRNRDLHARCPHTLTHPPYGQVLLMTAGRGRVQMDGGAVQEVKAGDVVRIPAHVRHWHGAAPDSSMTHIAIQDNLNGDAVDWLEPVTDKQYNGGK